MTHTAKDRFNSRVITGQFAFVKGFAPIRVFYFAVRKFYSFLEMRYRKCDIGSIFCHIPLYLFCRIYMKKC